MGTSKSSGGPGGKVPFIPPWVPPTTPAAPVPAQNGSAPGGSTPATSTQPPAQLAPPRRFAGARTNLGNFARTGSQSDLNAGLGHYTRTGLGGARRATQRMGRTSKTAGGLYGVLDAFRAGTPPPAELGISASDLAGRSASDIADHIANALCPADGTQDAEAGRDAVARALSDLMEAEPNADLLALSIEQIEHVVEWYVAYDLCDRIELDIGKSVVDKAPNYAEGVKRLEQIKEYVREKVSAQFRARAGKGERLTRQTATALTNSVLQDTFEIFEGYLQ